MLPDSFNPNNINWDLYIDDSVLSRRELYIADNCCQPKFKYLLNRAKEFWIQNGGSLTVTNVIEQGASCIQRYDYKDLRCATAYYLKNKQDEIKEMDKASAKRYRLRKKQQIALENIAKGLMPTISRGHISWTVTDSVNTDWLLNAVSGYYPDVQNNAIVWKQAPQKVKGK